MKTMGRRLDHEPQDSHVPGFRGRGAGSNKLPASGHGSGEQDVGAEREVQGPMQMVPTGPVQKDHLRVLPRHTGPATAAAPQKARGTMPLLPERAVHPRHGVSVCAWPGRAGGDYAHCERLEDGEAVHTTLRPQGRDGTEIGVRQRAATPTRAPDIDWGQPRKPWVAPGRSDFVLYNPAINATHSIDTGVPGSSSVPWHFVFPDVSV
eukprot:s6204_g2.t1